MNREFHKPYQCVHESVVSTNIVSLYGGNGTIEVSRLFRSEGFLAPILLAVYRIPPGASEGVHRHDHGDDNLGALDEMYYVISGRGHMIMDGRRVPVATGDCIFAPTGLPHGIENTSADTDLKVHIVAAPRS
jgi:oxalate decarboxylase/phosphoglucose isomerase-like protein (cupin superfamily)